MKSLFIFSIAILFLCCNFNDKSSENPKEENGIIEEKMEILSNSGKGQKFTTGGPKQKEMRKALLEDGNLHYYYELSVSYMKDQGSQDFLAYALLAANKYGHLQAYYDVFFCIVDAHKYDLMGIDGTSAKIAIDYLFLAYEKGHRQAKSRIEYYSIKREEDPREAIWRIYSSRLKKKQNGVKNP